MRLSVRSRRVLGVLVVLALAVVLVLVVSGSGASGPGRALARPTRAGGQPTFASNEARARSAAMRLLGELVLPGGGGGVRGNPAARGVASWLNRSVAGAPATPNLVDYHRFWRVPGRPQAVLTWLKAHRPSGARVWGTSTGG